MAATVESGVWEGQPIRKARKNGQCDYQKGRKAGGQCTNKISTGDLYMVGELNGGAGGFAQDRYCLFCAGPEAIDAARKY